MPSVCIGRVLAGLTPLLMAASAIGAPIQCPATIVESPQLAGVPSSWAVMAPSGERTLKQVGVYWGPQEELGALVPDGERIDKRQERANWTLLPKSGGHFWIGCQYHDTTAVLLRRLDESVKQCEAIYDLLPTGRRLRLVSVDCR